MLTLIQQGDLRAAAHLAQIHELPISQARVHLAQGDSSAALLVLEPLRQQAEAKGWRDEQLHIMVLQDIALYTHGEKEQAVHILGDALALAEPEGFIRIFVDEGIPMFNLLCEAASHGIMPDYIHELLAVFEAEGQGRAGQSSRLPSKSSQPLIEPLSEREVEVLRLLGTEMNGPEIARQLLVSLHTMRSHTKNIYNKLGANNRRAAIRRAGELHLL